MLQRPLIYPAQKAGSHDLNQEIVYLCIFILILNSLTCTGIYVMEFMLTIQQKKINPTRIYVHVSFHFAVSLVPRFPDSQW